MPGLTRSEVMSRIRGKDTAPELIVRRGLFRIGFRYRLHCHSLPGKPDIVLPRYRAVVLVHGCFWHGHNCRYFRLPKSRTLFWQTKISQNQTRDRENAAKLRDLGWRVGVVWECAIRGNAGVVGPVLPLLGDWLRGENSSFEVPK